MWLWEDVIMGLVPLGIEWCTLIYRAMTESVGIPHVFLWEIPYACAEQHM